MESPVKVCHARGRLEGPLLPSERTLAPYGRLRFEDERQPLLLGVLRPRFCFTTRRSALKSCKTARKRTHFSKKCACAAGRTHLLCVAPIQSNKNLPEGRWPGVPEPYGRRRLPGTPSINHPFIMHKPLFAPPVKNLSSPFDASDLPRARPSSLSFF